MDKGHMEFFLAIPTTLSREVAIKALSHVPFRELDIVDAKV